MNISDNMKGPFAKEVSGIVIRKLYRNASKSGKIKIGAETL